MSTISASAVRAFRERTGLPLMDCKQALTEAEGDEAKAIQILRERGEKLDLKRGDRETAFGRFGVYAGVDKPAGAIVELKCESAPVTQNEEFITLANALAEALAKNNVDSVDELLKLKCPAKPSMTLGEHRSELFNRIREKFEVGRFARFEGPTGAYSHNAGTVAGVLISVEGGSDEAVKDVAMHVAAMRPAALSSDELDKAEVERERGLLRDAALKEGKPAQIVDKMVEGRLKQYFAQHALLEQPFVKDDKQSVGDYAKSKGMKVKKFVCFVLGEVPRQGE